jgi:hypothetical protein
MTHVFLDLKQNKTYITNQVEWQNTKSCNMLTATLNFQIGSLSLNYFKKIAAFFLQNTNNSDLTASVV